MGKPLDSEVATRTDIILGPIMNQTIGIAGIQSVTISWRAVESLDPFPMRAVGIPQNWTNMAPGIRFQLLEQSGIRIVIRAGLPLEPGAGPGTILLVGPGSPT